MPYNEQDLNFLIEKHLQDCGSYTNVCQLKQTAVGKERIITRIKEILFGDGVKNIHEGSAVDAAIAVVESELIQLHSEEESD